MALGLIGAVFISCSKGKSAEQTAVEQDVLDTLQKYYFYDDAIKLTGNTQVTHVPASVEYDTVYHVSAMQYRESRWSDTQYSDDFNVDSVAIIRRTYPAHNEYVVEYEGTHISGNLYQSTCERVPYDGEMYGHIYEFYEYFRTHPDTISKAPCKRRYFNTGMFVEVGSWYWINYWPGNKIYYISLD